MNTTTHQTHQGERGQDSGLAVFDPADGTALAHLRPGTAHADPAEDVTIGPLHEVNGVTIQTLTRKWGARPTTYYLIGSHTPTVPLTRAETAHLAQALIDALNLEAS